MKFFISVLFLALFFLPKMVHGQPHIALLPFDNLSGIRAAPGNVMPAVEEFLSKKGFKILQKESLETFLREERIRFLDSLPTHVTQKLAKRFNLDAILVGSILAYLTEKNPQVGLSARLISREGNLLWGNTIALTGEDEAGILGIGRIEKIEDLISIAVKRLLENIQSKAGVRLPSWGGPQRMLLSKPRTYRSPLLDSRQSYRVGVFPLENQSTNKEASRIFLNLLVQRLAARDTIKVTESADVREVMIVETIRSFDDIDLEQIKNLGKRLETKLFVGGTILKYSEGLGASGWTTPEAELFLSMLDAETGKILWTGYHFRKGEDYLTVLQFGLIRSPVALADQVLEEMVRTMIKTKRLSDKEPGVPK